MVSAAVAAIRRGSAPLDPKTDGVPEILPTSDMRLPSLDGRPLRCWCGRLHNNYHGSVTPTNDATGPRARPKYGQYAKANANATDKSTGANARPQYGQYATPEEQRASIKEPDKYFEEFQAAALNGPGTGVAEPAVDAAGPGAPTQAGSERRTTASGQTRRQPASNGGPNKLDQAVRADQSAGPGQSGTSPADAVVTRHPADRVVTFILLAIGLFFTVAIVPGMLHPATGIEASYKQFGIGSYQATGLTQVVGIGVAFVYIVGWLYAAFASMKRMRAGKIAWWIPAVIGVAVWIITMIGFAVLMLSDPAFMNYATSVK